VPNQIALIRTMWSQTKACIAKSSCEKCALLRCYAALSRNSLWTLQDNPSVPSSWVKKSKERTEQTEVNWHTLLVWDLSIVYFFKEG